MSHKTLQKYISRLMALLLCALLLVPCIPAARAAESGTCGDNLSWSLSAGTLTISGSGEMTNYSVSEMAPWYPYREEIMQVELPGGLETIGELAFYECSNLMTVVIPDSVGIIGPFAFSDCENLKMVTFGSGVHSIKEAAFQNCYRLKSVSLPQSLLMIGVKAFYRCEDITSLRVPSSVVYIGSAAFGYCKSLVSADIRGRMDAVPEFLFYGCGNLATVSLPDTTSGIDDLAFYGCNQLETVNYNGSSLSLNDAQNAIAANQQNSGTNAQPAVSAGSTGNSGSLTKPVSSSTQSSSNGTVKQETITVIQGENATGSLIVEDTQTEANGANDTDAHITITVENERGWEEAQGVVDTLLNHVGSGSSTESEKEKLDVEIYLKGSEVIDSDFLENLSGKEVIISVITENGHRWKIDCSQLGTDNLPEKLSLNYTLTAGTDELTAELGGNASFVLKFAESAKVNAEVLIRLGNTWSNQGATLFQRENDGVSRIQAALVDYDGYTHFYLASVDKDTEYYIGMNIPTDMQEEAPIVPAEMLSNYGNVENIQPIQYEITGRKSSWNMGLGKVMAILAAVMISAIAVVGAVMFFWNKQRLKNGYVPKWDDDEE